MRFWTAIAAVTLTSIALPAPLLADGIDQDKQGNWVKINSNERKKSIDYVDLDSLRRDGDVAEIRLRTEFSEGYDGLDSGNALLEINCKTHKMRMMRISVTTTDGEWMEADKPTDWSQISETSPAFYAEKVACKK